MIDYDENIYKFLKQQEQYKNIQKKDILDGSQFNPRQFESICIDMYREFMQSFLSKDEIQIRILDIGTINGLAAISENNYFSLIHWGTITKIYEYSLLLTENPSFFPEIYSKKDWKIINKNDISESDKQKESFYNKNYICGTDDQCRRDLAFLISFFAWYSTIFHEAGHILDGHLAFRQNYFFESSLEILQKNTDTNIILKALEKDADEFSANRMIEYAFKSENVFLKDFSYIVKNDIILIQLIATGVTLKFLLYGINNNTSFYLPNAYRIINIMEAAYSNLKYNFKCQLSKTDYDKIIVDSIRTVITAFNSKLTPPIDINIFIKQLYVGLKENEELKLVWNKIYPDLSKFSRVSIAPLFE